MSRQAYNTIDVPFHFRHTCWFCGEPSSTHLDFPHSRNIASNLSHPLLSLPACRECCSLSYPRHVRSIWSLRAHLKQALLTKYTKHIAIGENWTEQELIESEFSGAILGGFGKSAWQMYQIAKQRIAFNGWALSIDDQSLEIIDDTANFEFDGTQYLSITACIDFYVEGVGVDKELLTQLVEILTPNRFGYALQIAKLNKRLSHTKRRQIIEEITLQEAESQQIEQEQQSLLSVQSAITAVEVSGATAPAFAIQWAIQKGARTLAELCQLEDDFFDEFATLGGAAAFHSYQGLQLYLQAREEKTWAQECDPNYAVWLTI